MYLFSFNSALSDQNFKKVNICRRENLYKIKYYLNLKQNSHK